ncbi:hypothetical protein IFVP182_C2120067 [Vibrio parahaemolyticus]
MNRIYVTKIEPIYRWFSSNSFNYQHSDVLICQFVFIGIFEGINNPNPNRKRMIFSWLFVGIILFCRFCIT